MILYNRQVTHNAHLYENQDVNELPTEILGHSQL
jgi:hypothetical protein